MRKEFDVLLRASAIFFVATSTACGGKGQESFGPETTPTPEVSPTPTPFQPSNAITPTFASIFTETPTLTPTPESPFIRRGIDFGKSGEITISMTKPLKFSSSGEIRVYPDVFPTSTPDSAGIINTQTPKELEAQQLIWLEENFSPGGGTFVTEKDSLGNVILFLHDGYINKKTPLEAEAMRSYLEGFKAKTINDPDHIKYSMQSLVGAIKEITQAAVSAGFEIEGIVQVPAPLVDFYDKNTEDLFENVYLISQVAGVNKTDGATEVVEEHAKHGGGLAISICGWGVSKDSEGKEVINAQATRYVIFLK